VPDIMNRITRVHGARWAAVDRKWRAVPAGTAGTRQGRSDGGSAVSTKLELLDELREQGVLTEAEFLRQRARILDD
jgi:hypothetical protein